jgi:hypothetical protein
MWDRKGVITLSLAGGHTLHGTGFLSLSPKRISVTFSSKSFNILELRLFRFLLCQGFSFSCEPSEILL